MLCLIQQIYTLKAPLFSRWVISFQKSRFEQIVDDHAFEKFSSGHAVVRDVYWLARFFKRLKVNLIDVCQATASNCSFAVCLMC